jgi:hypothetical protein
MKELQCLGKKPNEHETYIINSSIQSTSIFEISKEEEESMKIIEYTRYD